MIWKLKYSILNKTWTIPISKPSRYVFKIKNSMEDSEGPLLKTIMVSLRLHIGNVMFTSKKFKVKEKLIFKFLHCYTDFISYPREKYPWNPRYNSLNIKYFLQPPLESIDIRWNRHSPLDRFHNTFETQKWCFHSDFDCLERKQSLKIVARKTNQSDSLCEIFQLCFPDTWDRTKDK